MKSPYTDGREQGFPDSFFQSFIGWTLQNGAKSIKQLGCRNQTEVLAEATSKSRFGELMLRTAALRCERSDETLQANYAQSR